MQAAAAAALGRSGWRAKKHLSEALTRCDTGRAVGVRSCTAGPLQAPRGINVTALHFHLSPDWPRRSAEESRRGRSQVEGEGGVKLKGGGAERSRPPAKTVKCFQTRTVEQRRFGWCLISGGWGRGLWRGRPFVFPVSEAPHGRQLPVWEEDEEEEKKKLMVTSDHIFRTGFIQDGERQTVLVGSEREGGGRKGRVGGWVATAKRSKLIMVP